MGDLRFNGLIYLHLLWLVPALAVFYYAAFRSKRKALQLFADVLTLPKINLTHSPARARRKAALVIAAAALVVIGLTRPAWETEPAKLRRIGRDVVFVVDVSRSMLATDIKPNRLELAKLAMFDALEVVRGDRVGLVAFAGSAVMKCPLTFDYGFFRTAVKKLDPDAVSRAGTRIGDAVRKTLDEVFESKEKKYKDIVLITDGEDHDSFPVNAAEDAGNAGVRIIAIGLGDHERGTRIPVTNARGSVTFLKNTKGEYVYSKLDWRTLKEMTHASRDGRAYQVGSGETIDLAAIYARLIGEAEKAEHGAEVLKRYSERFQPFLALAFLLLCIELILGERK